MRRLFQKAGPVGRVGLLLGEDRLWLACGGASPLFDSRSLSGAQEWAPAITDCLSQHGLQRRPVTLALASPLYQQVQIDKPAVPDEEMAGALPWAIKDYVNEAVTQLALDYVDLPTPGRARINVIAVPKSRIQQLAEAVNRVARLEVITTDESALSALFEADAAVRLLLWQSGGQDLHLLVFYQGGLCFSRVLRGFRALPQSEPEPMQLDSLALEVQRSLDYLRSQLKLPECRSLQLALASPGLGTLVAHLEQTFGMGVSVMANKAMVNGCEYLPAYGASLEVI